MILVALMGRPPLLVAGATCLATAALVTANSWVRPPTGRWMVPREWARLGAVGYAFVFGVAQGTGVATVVPSAGMYALLTLAALRPSAAWTFSLLLTFAAGVSMLVLLQTAWSARSRRHPVSTLDRVRTVASVAATVEVFAAGALGVELLRAI